jgi:hypothetical protein
LIATEWITDVSWGEREVRVSADQATVRAAPEYDPSGWLDRDQELRLHGHYGLSGYWDGGPDAWRLRRPAA